MIHDPSIKLLAAATNPNPDPVKATDQLAIVSDSALVAGAGPAGTLADVASTTPSSDQIAVYVVRPGDTLADVARMFSVSVNTIVWANDLGSSRTLKAGQTLVILPVSGVEHTVVKGDTLKSLAKKFGADADEIAEYNGLDADAPLAIGTSIIVPGGELATVAPAPTKKSTTSKGVAYEPYLGGGGAAINGYFINPLSAGRITQTLHGWNGVDIGAPSGTAVRAAADGTVIVAKANKAWNGGYGNYIVVSHANGTQTLYSHLSQVIITPGVPVSQGQVIGYVGSTGLSTGPHLHFEVRGAANPLRNCPMGASCKAQ